MSRITRSPIRVFVNGCFDIIHVGHVRLIRHAAGLGSLVVAINSDDSVRRLKGSPRPMNRAWMRREVLLGMKGVHHVLVFTEDSPTALLEQMYDEGSGPDIIVKGVDYIGHLEDLPEYDVVTSNGGRFTFYNSGVVVSSSNFIKPNPYSPNEGPF